MFIRNILSLKLQIMLDELFFLLASHNDSIILRHNKRIESCWLKMPFKLNSLLHVKLTLHFMYAINIMEK